MANNNMEEVTKLSLRIGLEEKEAIAKYAEENDLSMSQVIRRAIKQFLIKIKDE